MKEEKFAKIGARIKKLRVEKRWTQTVLASKVRVDQGYIAALEKGVYEPANPMLVALSDVFKVPMTDINPDLVIDLSYLREIEGKQKEFFKE